MLVFLSCILFLSLTHMHIDTYTYTHTHTYVHKSDLTHTHICIHAYIHTYKYTHTHDPMSIYSSHWYLYLQVNEEDGLVYIFHDDVQCNVIQFP